MNQHQTPKVLRMSRLLQVSNILFISFWLLIAIFPLLWAFLMSFKLPLDSFATNPFQVIFGFETLQKEGGFSLFQIIIFLLNIYIAYKLVRIVARIVVNWLEKKTGNFFAWVILTIIVVLDLAIYFIWILPWVINFLTWLIDWIPFLNYLNYPILGFTSKHYEAVWIDNAFYENFINSMIITFGVVGISLTIGTLAGYALARSGSNIAFWLLIVALIFRALPHSVLVTGYLPVFINSNEILQPLWEWAVTGWFFQLFTEKAPTLYGQPLPVIVVLVAINQPFTIWMLRSFFQNIPTELDEAARVDGCSQFKAFRLVIMPIMWPGVITTGLFSFLLAYNDYLVTALLLDYSNQTMVPAITQYFNRETTTTNEIEAVAAAVSIVIPLFFLVLFFQKQIVSGLTQGAVKG